MILIVTTGFLAKISSYYLLVVALVALSVLIGTLACRVSNFFHPDDTNTAFQYLTALIIGNLIITTIYAVYKSSGMTLMYGLIPILLYLLWHRKKEKSYSWRINDLRLIAFILIGVLCYINFYGYFFILGDGSGFNHIFPDHVIYARLANLLNESGREINPLDLAMAEFDPNYKNLQPYHYPLLWFCALASFVSGLTEPITFEMLVLPYMFTGIALGFLAILKELGLKSLGWYVAAIALVYFCGFDHRIIASITGKAVVWDYSIAGFGDGKLGPLMLLITWQGVFYLRRQWNFVLVINVLICLFSITMLPSLALVSLLVIGLGVQDMGWKRILPPAVVGLLCGLIFLLLYWPSGEYSATADVDSAGFELMAFMKEIRYNLVVYGFVLFPLIAIAGVYIWQHGLQWRQTLALIMRHQVFHLMLCSGIGIVLFFVLYALPDRFQFQFVPRALFIPLFALFALYIVTRRIHHVILKTVLIVVFAASFVSGLLKNIEVQQKSHPSFNNDFARQALEQAGITTQSALIGIFTTKKTASLFDNSFLINFFGMELVYYNPSLRFVNLSILNDRHAWELPEIQPFIQKLPLVAFYGKTTAPSSEEEINTTINRFIQQHNIRYLMVEKGAEVPANLLQSATQQVKSKRTGDSFIILQ